MTNSFFRDVSVPPLFDHQQETVDFALQRPYVYDMSDAGTGKTRSWLEVLRTRHQELGGKSLVLAPKSILKNAWANDALFFTPELTVAIAYAHNRQKAFEAEADIYVTNHDAVKWIAAHWQEFFAGRGFHTLIVDEFTAFKHRTSKRSKALRKIASHFDYRAGLSGTPNPNGVTDLWHQVFILDEGERLGDNFYRFRNMVCEPVQVGPQPQMVRWEDKPGSGDAVADIISDITIRHVFEECTDIPENTVRIVPFELSPKHRRAYEVLREHAVLELKEGGITAFNKAVLANKLLQMASGAVYDDEQITQLYDSGRYELVMELVSQREQCVVAFNWSHQKEGLVREAEKRQFTFGVIDGSTTSKQRERIIDQFQAGHLRLILAHPATAGHGLTLTRGTTTIWTSPTYNAEYYTQFNKRIYRIGQTRKTETLLVGAENTIDVEVYKRLMGKVERMEDLLEMLE